MCLGMSENTFALNTDTTAFCDISQGSLVDHQLQAESWEVIVISPLKRPCFGDT